MENKSYTRPYTPAYMELQLAYTPLHIMPSLYNVHLLRGLSPPASTDAKTNLIGDSRLFLNTYTCILIEHTYIYNNGGRYEVP